MFPGLIADGDHQIEAFSGQVIQRFGAVVGDIDAQFGHDLDGHGVDMHGPRPGGKRLNLACQVMIHQALGHLAAAGVLRA
jgi:hypothetical protein